MKKNEKGYSLVEVIIACSVLSLLFLAMTYMYSNASKANKTIDEKKYLTYVSQNLINKIEDDSKCSALFSNLPVSFSWKQVATQSSSFDFNNNAISSANSNIYDVKINGVSNFATGIKISAIEIDKLANAFTPLAALASGELGTVTIPVKFPITKAGGLKTYLTNKYLTKLPIPIVFIFKKSGSDYLLDHCYARGSALISEERELCNSMGGNYNENGCKFSMFAGNSTNFGKYQAGSKPSSTLSLQESLCEFDKRVIIIEKTPLPKIVDPSSGATLVPGVASKDSITRYCSAPVSN